MRALFIKSVVVTVFGFFSLVCGCNEVDRSVNSVPGQDNKVPGFLVGTWQSSDAEWEVTFGSDGSLYSIKYYFNYEPIIISEGGGSDFFSDGSVRSFYVLGDHKISFNAETRVLTVEIAIDHFQVKRFVGDYEGNMDDKLSGRVSENNKSWDVVWDNRTTIYGLEGDSITSEKLLFTRLEEESND